MMTARAHETVHSSKEKLDHHKEIQLCQNSITVTVITQKDPTAWKTNMLFRCKIIDNISTHKMQHQIHCLRVIIGSSNLL